MRSNLEGSRLDGCLIYGNNTFGRLVQTLGGTFTGDADMAHLWFLDPGGAARTVLLPPESAGLWYFIRNTADASELLTVNEDSNTTTIMVIPQNAGAWFFCDGTTWFATAAGGNNANGIVAATAATLAVNGALHNGKLITLDRAAGITVTLPAATGSGAQYEFYNKTTVTSNNHVIQVTTDDVMKGTVWMASDNAADAAIAFETAVDSDTITMNGSTKGGIIGDRITLIDVATDTWSLQAFLQGTGTEVTPLSAAVV